MTTPNRAANRGGQIVASKVGKTAVKGGTQITKDRKMEKSTPLPEPPQPLTDAGFRLWSAITTEYELEPAALEILALACEAYSRSRQAGAILDRDGLMSCNRFGDVHEHPAVKAERDARGQCLVALKMLGLTLEPVGPIGRPAGH
jgi:P27 family predicted phage terminase small subunit